MSELTIIEDTVKYIISSDTVKVVFVGGIIGLGTYFIIKRKRCKHKWQITYQSKKNSFFCIKCGKKSKGVK